MNQLKGAQCGRRSMPSGEEGATGARWWKALGGRDGWEARGEPPEGGRGGLKLWPYLSYLRGPGLAWRYMK